MVAGEAETAAARQTTLGTADVGNVGEMVEVDDAVWAVTGIATTT